VDDDENEEENDRDEDEDDDENENEEEDDDVLSANEIMAAANKNRTKNMGYDSNSDNGSVVAKSRNGSMATENVNSGKKAEINNNSNNNQNENGAKNSEVDFKIRLPDKSFVNLKIHKNTNADQVFKVNDMKRIRVFLKNLKSAE
jgi:hypothetical protein